MVLAQIPHQVKPYMIRVCFYLKHALHRNVLNVKPLEQQFHYVVVGLKHSLITLIINSLQLLFLAGQKETVKINFSILSNIQNFRIQKVHHFANS